MKICLRLELSQASNIWNVIQEVYHGLNFCRGVFFILLPNERSGQTRSIYRYRGAFRLDRQNKAKARSASVQFNPYSKSHQHFWRITTLNQLSNDDNSFNDKYQYWGRDTMTSTSTNEHQRSRILRVWSARKQRSNTR